MTRSTFTVLLSAQDNDIQTDDIVSDGKNSYTAWRPSEYVRSTGMVNVVDKDLRHHDYEVGIILTVTAEIDDEYAGK